MPPKWHRFSNLFVPVSVCQWTTEYTEDTEEKAIFIAEDLVIRFLCIPSLPWLE